MAITIIHDGKRIHGVIIFRPVDDVNPLALFQNSDFDAIVEVQGVLRIGVSTDVVTVARREIFQLINRLIHFSTLKKQDFLIFYRFFTAMSSKLPKK